DLDCRLDAVANLIANNALWKEPRAVAFDAPAPVEVPQLLAGVRIGIASDDAFSFLYAANLDLLPAMGAELRFFSVLAHAELPEIDSLWLPGGYPELHLQRLASNTAMKSAIRAHHYAGKPMLAECGGMLYTLRSLTDTRGHRAAMLALMPGDA